MMQPPHFLLPTHPKKICMPLRACSKKSLHHQQQQPRKATAKRAVHATPVHVHLASVQTGSIIEIATATANNSIN
jgi:hypothetical protein